MKIKCIAIDDEQFALDALKGHCALVPYLDLVAVFSDPYDAFRYLQLNETDLLFLDIQMPDMSGIEILKNIPEKPSVIFTTAHTRYAVDGFNLNALDYLLKPFDFERFQAAVAKAKEKSEMQQLSMLLKKKEDFITVKVEYKNVRIFISDILYIEALDNYSKIFTSCKTILTLQNLRNIQTLLPVEEFLRIHKSFIVSKSKIAGYTREKIVIGSKQLTIGRAYSRNFLSQMSYELC